MDIDNRKYARFLSKDNTFAALGFGTVGKVKDISMGGLAFGYINTSEYADSDHEASHKDIFKPLFLDVFLSNNKFHLSDVPCKIIYDLTKPLATKQKEFISSIRPRICGVKFVTLSEYIMERLEYFLKKHTTRLSR